MKVRTAVTVLICGGVLALVANWTSAQTGKESVEAAKIREDLKLEEQKLQRQFREFEEQLHSLKRLLKDSKDPDDFAKADLIEMVIEKARGESITIQFEQINKILRDGKLGLGETKLLQGKIERLANDLQELVGMMSGDPRALKNKEDRKLYEAILKNLNVAIEKQKDVLIRTELGKADPKELEKAQNEVTKLTGDISKALDKLGKGDKGGEAKNAKGESKPGETKGSGKSGEAKEGGKESKAGEAKEGKAGEGKEGSAKGSEPKSGDPAESKSGSKPGEGADPKSGAKGSKGGEGAAGKPKEGAGKEGEKGKEGSAKDDGADKNPVKEKPGEAKGGEAKSGTDPKGPEAKSGESKKGPSPDSKGGEAKASKGGESKAGPKEGGKPGAESKGESKPGESSSGKGEPKPGSESGEPSKSSSKGGGDDKKDQPQIGKKKIDEAEGYEKAAEDYLRKKKNAEAADEAAKAGIALEAAKKEIEKLLRQTRQEELERLLAQLQARCEKMLVMQVRVYNQTVSIEKALASLDAVDPDKEDKTRQAKISAGNQGKEEGLIILEVDKALKMLEAEGSAVAFPEVFQQVKGDMELVKRRLDIADVGAVTQAVEIDIIDTLKEMVAALKKAIEDNKDKKDSKGDGKSKEGGPPPDQKLLDQIAELKMIKSMQLRVNARTSTYARLYVDREGEQARDPNIRRELRNLAERQVRITEITGRIAKGDNR